MHNAYRFLASAVVGLSYFAQPVYAETTAYDYHHASECHAYNGSFADQDFGYVANTNNSIEEIVCPISRIYPRTPHRLTKVDVDLSRYNPGNTAVNIYVCAKGFWYENNAVCVNKTAYLPGLQRITFDQDDLANIRELPFSWAHYMYIAVQQAAYDKLYGYVAYYDLN